MEDKHVGWQVSVAKLMKQPNGYVYLDMTDEHATIRVLNVHGLVKTDLKDRNVVVSFEIYGEGCYLEDGLK